MAAVAVCFDAVGQPAKDLMKHLYDQHAVNVDLFCGVDVLAGSVCIELCHDENLMKGHSERVLDVLKRTSRVTGSIAVNVGGVEQFVTGCLVSSVTALVPCCVLYPQTGTFPTERPTLCVSEDICIALERDIAHDPFMYLSLAMLESVTTVNAIQFTMQPSMLDCRLYIVGYDTDGHKANIMCTGRFYLPTSIKNIYYICTVSSFYQDVEGSTVPQRVFTGSLMIDDEGTYLGIHLGWFVMRRDGVCFIVQCGILWHPQIHNIDANDQCVPSGFDVTHHLPQ